MRDSSRGLITVLAPAAAVVLVALCGQFFDSYIQYVLCLCLLAMMIGTALVPMVGYAKVVMLASGAMMGIGAYLSSLLMLHLKIPFLWTVIGSVIAGALAGLVVGLPALRFRGHHLAMVTLVFQSLVIILLREWKSMTGGAEGIRVPKANVFGYEIRSDADSLWLICAFTVLTVLVIGILLHGRFGKTLRAISASATGAMAFGVNLSSFRIATFVLTGAFLSLAGAILAPLLKIIDPESFGLMQSINALAYPIVGGVYSVWGGVIGGGLLRAMPEALRSLADFAELAFTVIALVFILLLPGGLTSLPSLVLARWRTRRSTPTEAASPSAPTQRTGIESQPSGERSVTTGDALQIRSIGKRYGQLVAVSDVSLTVKAGEIHGLIGPNGAGKTTLFNIVSGLTPPDSGSVRIFGVDSADVTAVGRIRLGMTRTFQHLAVFNDLSCRDNVIVGLGENGIGQTLSGSFGELFHGVQARRRRQLADEALEAVGLLRRARDPAGTLSVGDQRRLEIARAIASRPKLLLLDEPVSGVAREDELRLIELLRTLNQQWRLTMLLIEHNIRFVVDCCDQLAVMHQGSLVTEGEPRSVIAQPFVQQIYFGKT